jgi:hypothetical protein
MQLGVIEQMHRVNDSSLTMGGAHLEAACRILVGGVISPAAVPAASGVAR